VAVVKEWKCVACVTDFESTEEKPRCPHGCSAGFVVQEFRTAPRIRSGSTSATDRNMRVMAQDLGMTDMSNRDGQSVMSSTLVGSGGVKREYAQHQVAQWKAMLPTGWAGTGEAPRYSHEQAGFQGTNTPMKPLLDSKPSLRSRTVFQKPK
jgi:hypothetical protein